MRNSSRWVKASAATIKSMSGTLDGLRAEIASLPVPAGTNFKSGSKPPSSNGLTKPAPRSSRRQGDQRGAARPPRPDPASGRDTERQRPVRACVLLWLQRAVHPGRRRGRTSVSPDPPSGDLRAA